MSWSPTTSSARPTRTPQAEFAKAWLTYVTSDEGQKAAHQDAAGTAPLPSSLKSEITKSIEAIKTK